MISKIGAIIIVTVLTIIQIGAIVLNICLQLTSGEMYKIEAFNNLQNKLYFISHKPADRIYLFFGVVIVMLLLSIPYIKELRINAIVSLISTCIVFLQFVIPDEFISRNTMYTGSAIIHLLFIIVLVIIAPIYHINKKV
jgi:hypothetical protein